MKIDKEPQSVINKLKANGFEAYLVGGCVRDYIMKITPKDYDITTNAKPHEIEALFEKTIDTGANYGTITVIINKTPIEVTTYRIDGEYKNNRHPLGVEFTTDLIEDLKRRDFTINSIAYDGLNFIDPFQGKEDIEKKIIKGVGEPSKRFEEDALRILRAIRFSCQLGFDIEKETLNAINEKTHLIKNISVERIATELKKTILSDHLENMKLLNIIFQKTLNIKLDYEKIINTPKDLIIRLALLSITKETLKNLKFSNKEIEDVAHLQSSKKPQNRYEAKKIINKIGFENFYRLLKLHTLEFDKTFNGIEREPIFLKDLKVTGKDIMELGITGKQIGEVLSYLLNIVHEEKEKNDKKQLLMEVLKCKK
ncbi:MAG: CCA tRNA nucleotidyltransferase [Defluviitaleaceae bacterium]|nr:CCA tRNA nucleotidyltransferase [Defluviitaleaceae bacterium]